MGPTASGKSGAAEALADRLDAILVNADASQAYRGFDIGTNKPGNAERYHLIGHLDPTESYGVGQWLREVEQILAEARGNGRHVVVVGGTGLYIRALFEGYDSLYPPPPEALRQELSERAHREGVESLYLELQRRSPDDAARVDPSNSLAVRRALERLEAEPINPPDISGFSRRKFGMSVPAEALLLRIASRLEEMLASGWEREVRLILEAGVEREAPAWRAIGYEHLHDAMEGVMTRDEAHDLILRDTRRYAKRQRTWLRREPDLIEIDAGGDPPPSPDQLAERMLALL